MGDVLRVTRAVPEFHEAVRVHLLEMSPALKEVQQNTLQGYSAHWHERLEDVPVNVPLIVFGNEFFDALPVQQFIFVQGQWCERKVKFKDDVFTFCHEPVADLPCAFGPAIEGDLFEYSAASLAVMRLLSDKIAKQGGGYLFIDYGYQKSMAGETLQAVQEHKFHDVLQDIGQADLTAHVDFERLQNAARESELFTSPVIEQGMFLNALGGAHRLDMLQQNANAKQSNDLASGYQRLVHKDQMGSLFKVVSGCSKNLEMAGLHDH